MAMPVKNFLILVLVLGLFAGCRGDSADHAEQHDVPGVNSTTILLGSSLPLTGHASYLGTQTKIGAEIYLKHINNQGGVHGRKIKLVALDDQYDPPQCLANTQRLIIRDKVFALFCYVGTPTTVKVLPMIKEARIPLLGMFTGANALREPFTPYLINIRPSYYRETESAVRHLVQDLGLERFAVFYQYDAYGFDGLTGTELALKEFGLSPVARSSYTRGTIKVEKAVREIVASDAQAVFMIGSYNPCAEFVRQAASRDFHPLYYTVSFVGAEELARRLKDLPQERLIMSQVVPPPLGSDSRKKSGAVREYIRLLKRYYPKERPNFVGLEGYINARVLVEGLRRCGRDLSRKEFISAIESIKGYTLGDDMEIDFGPKDHQGLKKIYFTILKDNTFVPLKDWGELKND